MKFAIIMPLFNKEQFVKEAIESVLKQTYRKKIQLIVINDGSTDNSEKICNELAGKHPTIITYVSTDNKGPAAARNLGHSYVSKDTDIVGYLDADDVLGQNVIERASYFFNKYDVNMAVLPIKYFNSERVGNEHSLNYRFQSGDTIINLLDNYQGIHFYAGGLFLKKDVLEESIEFFEEGLHFWEDAYSINRYLIKHPRYGVISDAYYYYRRKDKSNDSVVDNYWRKKERYTRHLNQGYLSLIQLSRQRYNKVLPFLQYLIAFHIKLYLFEKNYKAMMTTLNDKEQIAFKQKFIEVLQHIEVEIILKQEMEIYFKSFLIDLKTHGLSQNKKIQSGQPSEEKIVIKQKKLALSGLVLVGSLSERHHILDYHDNVFISNGKKRVYSEKRSPGKKLSIWDVEYVMNKKREFKITIPYYLLNFRFYLQIEEKIVSLNSFNYYKRFIQKVKEIIQKK